MFNRPPRRFKLYAVTDSNAIIAICPTKKLAKQIANEHQQVVEMFWTGGFYSTEKSNIQDITYVPMHDF